MLVTPVNDTFVAPVVGVPDVDVVDAGYSGDGIGAYHLEIPVFANDLDPNGPDPADPASGVRIPAINGIQGVDASAGTATRLDERTVVFTPTDGFGGADLLQLRGLRGPRPADAHLSGASGVWPGHGGRPGVGE